MKNIALLSLLPGEKKGPLFKPRVLNRIAPFFFSPRLRGALVIPELGLTGFRLMIFMGPTNWENMEEKNKLHFAQRVHTICVDRGISELGVSRRLDTRLFAGCDGENFVTAWALVWIKEQVTKHKVRRLVIISDHNPELLVQSMMERYSLPVTWQSNEPVKHEPEALKLLYRTGIPVSLAPFQPQDWEAGDLIICRGEGYANWACHYGKGSMLNLSNGSKGHAPVLEQALSKQGLDPGLHNLAPLLEAYCAQGSNRGPREIINVMEQMGDGIWSYFLDKPSNGLYNTLKGF
jgi:hypothetical protein